VAQRSNRFLTALIACTAVVLVAASSAMAARVIGNGSSNVLTGTPQHDVMLGRAGDDTINALARADLVRAGAGADLVNGGRGADRIRGGDGNDTLNGNLGWDFIRGGTGSDTINGAGGHDLISGGRDDDVLSGGARGDLIFANRGRDKEDGGDGPDRLWALSRFDVASIGDPNGDELTGGNGNDRFRVRDGEVDLVHCGAGIDRVKADQFDAVDADCEHVDRRDVTSLDQVDDHSENRVEPGN
jgi:Ca2+-binding RTX toxin-like protein